MISVAESDEPLLDAQHMPGPDWFARNVLESLQRLQSAMALQARGQAELKETFNLMKQELKHLNSTLDLRFQENERRITALELAAKTEELERQAVKAQTAVDRNNTRWLMLLGSAAVSVFTALVVKFWPQQ